MSESLRILVIEDDPSINEVVCAHLTRQGHCCVGAFSGTEGMLHLEHGGGSTPFDLVITDLMLPGMTGEDIVGRIRATSATLPIIVISARITPADKVMLLTLGADDYLTKPFSVIELVSRVRAVLRRCQPQESTGTLRCGELTLDTAEHTVSVAGQRVDLTYKEYELLRLFMTHPGRAFTRDKLMELVWGTDYCGESRTVDMHIRTLRQKLGDAGTHIQTIRSVGYRWEDNT